MSADSAQQKRLRLLVRLGQGACLLFVLVFILLGITREGYSPAKHAISSLSIGRFGWMQQLNFCCCGLLIAFSSIGFYRFTSWVGGQRWTSFFFALAGTGLFGAGIFSSDPVFGYPATEPMHTAQFTPIGHLHDFFSMFFFVGAPVTAFKMYNRFRKLGKMPQARLSLIAGIAILCGLVISGIGFRQVEGLRDFAGYLQRFTVMTALGWLFFLLQFSLNPNHDEQ